MERDEQNFRDLQRLLVLKRHETPPPGYFDNFSREVIVRIKAGDRGESPALVEKLSWESTWFGRLWTALEARPALAALCGVAVCGLLVSGLIFSESSGDSPAGIAIFMAPEVGTGLKLANDSAPLPTSPLLTPVGAQITPSSTGGLMPASTQPGSLFNYRPALNVQPASHSTGPGQ